MATIEEKAKAATVDKGRWKDPRTELPEQDVNVLAIITYMSGAVEEPEIMSYDGKCWLDSCGHSFDVIAWMPIPQLPENWPNPYKVS